MLFEGRHSIFPEDDNFFRLPASTGRVLSSYISILYRNYDLITGIPPLLGIREGALSLAYMYISLTSGRPDPSSFKTPIQIATLDNKIAISDSLRATIPDTIGAPISS
jgi:hypothetical protein